MTVAAITVSCKSRGSDSTQIRTRLAPGEDVILGWSATFEHEILRSRDPDEPFASLTKGLVAADRHRRIYVYDDPSGKVLVLDSSGTVLGTRGRRGRGPGEISNPSGLGVDAEGGLVVFDVAKSGLVRFAPSGEILPEVRIVGMHEGGPIVTAPGLVTMGVVELDRQGHQLVQRLVVLADTGSSEVLATVAQPLTRAMRFPGCPNPVVLPPLFAPRLVWSGNDQVVAAVSDASYTIALYRNERPPIRIGRDIKPRSATRQLALQEVASARLPQKEGSCRVSPAELVEARGFASEIPEVAGLAVSPSGELWVRRQSLDSEGAVIDVFSAEGEYHGSLPSGTPFPDVFLDRLHFLVVERGEDGVAHLRLYRLNR